MTARLLFLKCLLLSIVCCSLFKGAASLKEYTTVHKVLPYYDGKDTRLMCTTHPDLSLSPAASRSVPALCICIQSSTLPPVGEPYSQGPKDSLDYRVFFKQGGARVADACFFQTHSEKVVAMHALGNLYPSLSTQTQPRLSPLGTRSLCMPETETCTTSARSPRRPPPRWRWPRCVGGGGEARAKKR